jgi:hypothetical protein
MAQRSVDFIHGQPKNFKHIIWLTPPGVLHNVTVLHRWLLGVVCRALLVYAGRERDDDEAVIQTLELQFLYAVLSRLLNLIGIHFIPDPTLTRPTSMPPDEHSLIRSVLRSGAFLSVRVAKDFDLMILPRRCCPTYVGMVASSRFRYKLIFGPAFGMAEELSPCRWRPDTDPVGGESC